MKGGLLEPKTANAIPASVLGNGKKNSETQEVVPMNNVGNEFSNEAHRALPKDAVRDLDCLGLRWDEKTLIVGAPEESWAAVQKLADSLKITIKLVAATAAEIREAVSLTETIDSTKDASINLPTTEAGEAPISHLVQQILDRAVLERASDLHFETYKDHALVRVRIDGELLDGVDVEIRGGKIFIRGPILASSISLDAGWYETSDLGELDNEKLKVIGRADDVIITGGENLSLNTVEASLNSAFPAIEFAAFAVEDPQWGQSLQIAVVGSVLDDEIIAHLEKDLGAFAKPKGIHHLASLPLLGIGKVDRKSLAKGVAHE